MHKRKKDFSADRTKLRKEPLILQFLVLADLRAWLDKCLYDHSNVYRVNVRELIS